MKKRITVLLTALFCIVLLTPAAFAANRVPEMEIEVALRQDGSACVTQIWTTDTDEGTEFYLARHNSGYLFITDFSVSDQNGPYSFVDDWDVNASFEEKAGKCGVLETDDKLGVASSLCEEDALLGAYLLRLVSQGCLESTDDSIDAESVRLRLCRPPRSENEYDDVLYTILEAAAGADGVLDPTELERYCGQNYLPLSRFVDSCERNGMQTLIKGGCLKGAVLDNDKDLTKKGQQELDEIFGLKHFLLDFSLIQERGIKETVIWQDYMVYALMLGIADKLEPQIQDLYPDQLPQLDQYRRYVRYSSYYNKNKSYSLLRPLSVNELLRKHTRVEDYLCPCALI